jgi:polygalacturonase
VTANSSACTATSWIDVRCYGATGNGSTDDTAAINRALSAALATDQPLFLPHGTFKLTRPLVIDYRTRSDTGFRVMSMGAILDGKTIAAQPVLEILCSGGTPISPKGCFYFNEQGTLFVNGRSDSYAVVIGRPDFSDAQNSLKIEHLIVNNAGAGGRAPAQLRAELRNLCRRRRRRWGRRHRAGADPDFPHQRRRLGRSQRRGSAADRERL